LHGFGVVIDAKSWCFCGGCVVIFPVARISIFLNFIFADGALLGS
jgi:hypothetical protein